MFWIRNKNEFEYEMIKSDKIAVLYYTLEFQKPELRDNYFHILIILYNYYHYYPPSFLFRYLERLVRSLVYLPLYEIKSSG